MFSKTSETLGHVLFDKNWLVHIKSSYTRAPKFYGFKNLNWTNFSMILSKLSSQALEFNCA